MATIECIDIRRTDLRNNALANPYTITSGEMTNAGDDLGILLFSFPSTVYGGNVLITDIMLEVITGFDGTPVMTIGCGTLATDAITTGGDITIVDADSLYTDAIAIPETAGLKMQGTGAFLTGKAAGTKVTEVNMIVPAATTVPCIYATLTATDAITVGSAYLHMNIIIMDTVA